MGCPVTRAPQGPPHPKKETLFTKSLSLFLLLLINQASLIMIFSHINILFVVMVTHLSKPYCVDGHCMLQRSLGCSSMAGWLEVWSFILPLDGAAEP